MTKRLPPMRAGQRRRLVTLSEPMRSLLDEMQRRGVDAILVRSRQAPDLWGFGEIDESFIELIEPIALTCTVFALARRGLVKVARVNHWHLWEASLA